MDGEGDWSPRKKGRLVPFAKESLPEAVPGEGGKKRFITLN